MSRGHRGGAGRRWASKVLLLLSVVPAACAVGPDFEPPADPTATRYEDPATATTSHQAIAVGAAIPDAWWQLFRNPLLDPLVRQAIADSQTLAAARATVAQATETVIQARAAYYPQLSVAAGASRQGTGGTVGIGGLISNYFSFGPSVSIPLDLFGGIGRQVEQAQANAENERDQLAAAYLTLTSNAVLEAIAIAAARVQIDAANELIANDTKNLALVRQKFEVGKATKADILTAQSQLTNDRTTVPALRQQLAVARHALAILVGKSPAAWTPPDFDVAQFTIPAVFPVSVPSALVHQRPDILAAEAQLRAASAAIGVATAAQYPTIALSASLSQGASHLGQITSAASRVWNVDADASETLYSGDALSSQKRGAIDFFVAQRATYRQTVLTAFDQVADALHALDEDAQASDLARQALDIATASLALQQAQFAVGKATVLDLIVAENAYTQARLSSVRVSIQRLQDSVQLFVVVGGGWWNRSDPL